MADEPTRRSPEDRAALRAALAQHEQTKTEMRYALAEQLEQAVPAATPQE